MEPDGTYQADHYRIALPYVTDRSRCLDAGAHVGTWSRLMAADFAEVIAVEPFADTCAALRANMAAFGCSNVAIHQVALGATPGFVSMAPLEPQHEAAKNTGARFVKNGGEITRITIDSLALPSLGFLKLDIEGAEVDALAGARETIRRCKPIVLFECKWFWRRYGHAIDAPQVLLAGMGYREIGEAGRDRIWGPK
jgi:FkbM family methyltransferase